MLEEKEATEEESIEHPFTINPEYYTFYGNDDTLNSPRNAWTVCLQNKGQIVRYVIVPLIVFVWFMAVMAPTIDQKNHSQQSPSFNATTTNATQSQPTLFNLGLTKMLESNNIFFNKNKDFILSATPLIQKNGKYFHK